MADNLDDDGLKRGMNDLESSAELANSALQQMAKKLGAPVEADPVDSRPSAAEKSTMASLKSGVKASAAALGTASSAVRDFARQVDAGGDAFESMETLAEGAVDTMGELGGGFEKMADFLRLFSGAARALNSTLSEQKQTWQELSKIGASGAAGLRDIQRQYLSSQLDLKTFGQAIGAASEGLAVFRGTVSQGTDDFASMMNTLNQGDMTMRRLGMDQQEIVASTTGYINIMAVTGKARNMSTAQMTQGAKDYAIQLDTLARLTGDSRDAINKQQDEDLRKNDRLLAVMHKSGGDATNVQAIYTAIKTQLGEQAAQGFLDMKSGAAGTEAAQYYRTMYGSKVDYKSVQDAMVGMQSSLNESFERSQSNAVALGEGADYGKDFSKMVAFRAKDFSKMEDAHQDQQDSLMAKDKQTERTIETEKSLQKIQNDYNSELTKFLPVFADVTNKTAHGMRWLSDQVLNLGPTIEKITGQKLPSLESAYDKATGSIRSLVSGGGEAGGGAIIDQARSMMGKTETGNRSELIDYLNQNSGTQMRDVVGDAYAWCARYVNATLGKLGIEGTHSASAASFKTFGESVWDRSKGEDLSGVKAGDIIVVQRSGGSGSHVAFVEGIDQATGRIKIVGGNQGGARAGGGGVTESSVSLGEVQAIRRAPGAERLAAAPISTQKPEPEAPAAPVNVVQQGLGIVVPEKMPADVTPTVTVPAPTISVVSTTQPESQIVESVKPQEPTTTVATGPEATTLATATPASTPTFQAPVSDLTVPASKTTTPPQPDQMVSTTTTVASAAPTISFQETITLLQSVSSKIDSLRQTNERNLASMQDARRKAKV